MKAARLVAIAALTVAPLAASAGTPAAAAPESPAAAIEAHALTHVREGQIRGCGLRLTGGRAGQPASSWFDISLNVFERGIGLAQSIAYEFRSSGYNGESRPARVPVQRTWVRAAQRTARLGENIERRDSLVYALLIEDVLALFEAVAAAQPVTLGVRSWGQREDTVFTGTPALTDESREEISTCLAALSLS